MQRLLLILSVLFILLSSFFCAVTQAQIFNLGLDKGLSNNSVKCIFQDSKGYMWFGTFDGLNRYDGYEIRSYRNKLNDSGSLPHNYIYCIAEDHFQKLWIGTGQGVGIYDGNFDSFSRLRFHPHWDTNDTQVLNADAKTIQVDLDNNIYVGTNGWGLFVKNAQNDVADWIPLREKNKEDSYYYHAAVVYIDPTQHIWVFINGEGLFQYNKKTKSLSLVNDRVLTAQCMISDKHGNLFLGNTEGLYGYSIQAKEYTQHYKDELPSPSVNQLALEDSNRLWVATQSGIVSVLDLQKKTFGELSKNEIESNSILTNLIYSVYVDTEHRKWFGTSKSGVSFLDLFKDKFKTDYAIKSANKNLPNRFVRSFMELDSHHIWIGTDGGGIAIWNTLTDDFQFLKKGINQLSDNIINHICKDSNGHVWIATNNGINRYTEGGGFKWYPCYNETGEENKDIEVILEDEKHHIWATTFGNGKLYRYNPSKDVFEMFSSKLMDLVSLAATRDGYLWGGDYHQLIKIDPRTAEIKTFEIGKPVRAIHLGRNGQMWLGTEGKGLIAFDPLSEKITGTYADNEGLSNNSVLTIEEDDSGNLWLSTFNGLSKFNPTKKEFTNFDQSDGLQSNEFSYGASLRLTNGRLMFGGVNGFNLFHPDSVSYRSYTPKVVITEVRINNRLLNDSLHHVDLDEQQLLSNITLPYKEAIISLNFAALEYSSAHKIRYRYMLKGWDKDWNLAGSNRSINYNNLMEGSYTLMIQSTNAEGEWVDNTKELHFKILPPWYRTWWAYLLYLAVIATALRQYILYRNKQTKLKYEVELANLNAKKERELHEKRQSFFTNVSHEFRTPLTLIISPVKELLKKSSDNKEKSKLKIVQRNATRLLSLVDQLLLFRKAEDESDNLKMSRFDLISFAREIYLCFGHQAQQQHISYQFTATEEQLEIIADKEKLEIVLYNLLSNAFKFTPENGKIDFSIQKENQQIQLTIADTGIGIPEEVGDNIFTKFYSDSRKGVKQKPGFGIGMYLTKTFVHMLDGEINYTSTLNVGTTFKVTLPHQDQPVQESRYPADTIESHTTVIQELMPEMEEDTELELEATEASPNNVTNITQDTSLLIVDDDKQIRDYLYDLFQDEYILHTAKDGNEALTIIEQHQPEIVISDVMMGGMNGIELCAKIKSNPSYGHIQVILLTSSPSDAHKLEGIEEGADDYVNKPFDAELLKARVLTLIKNRKNLQQFFYNAITLQSNDLKISPKDKEFIEQCIRVVEDNIKTENFNVKILSHEMSTSYSSLYKRVKAISGKTVNELIRDIRLRKAAQLFIDTDLKVNEAANETGFYDIKYFRTQFSKLFGMNPSAYIKKYRKAFQNEYRLKDE